LRLHRGWRGLLRCRRRRGCLSRLLWRAGGLSRHLIQLPLRLIRLLLRRFGLPLCLIGLPLCLFRLSLRLGGSQNLTRLFRVRAISGQLVTELRELLLELRHSVSHRRRARVAVLLRRDLGRSNVNQGVPLFPRLT